MRGWGRLRGWFSGLDFGNSIVIYRVDEETEIEPADEIDFLASELEALEMAAFEEALDDAKGFALEPAGATAPSAELRAAGLSPTASP